jgi:phenylacetic acid degradation protein paaN
MNFPLFEKHKPTLERAVAALSARTYWSPYSESPSPKAYGETAAQEGKSAFESYIGKVFPLDQPGRTGTHGGERSPYGTDLNITYPICDPEQLIQASLNAAPAWEQLGHSGRAGLLIEVLERLNRRSFEIGHAVMMTTGQGWMMAFQAGGPHAQDRALEAVAQAWREQSMVPLEAIWEKPQGKNPPLRMRKQYEIVGRGVALVIGCGTFPTWNTYPGVFAALATGNPVIVKPHSNAILPAAITVSVIREVLSENGLDPNVACSQWLRGARRRSTLQPTKACVPWTSPGARSSATGWSRTASRPGCTQNWRASTMSSSNRRMTTGPC